MITINIYRIIGRQKGGSIEPPRTPLPTPLITSSKHLAAQVIFDYEGISQPCSVYNGDLPMLMNRNGEADYNVWFHCMTSTSRNIILGSDTDIWVYGFMVYGLWDDVYGRWLISK